MNSVRFRDHEQTLLWLPPGLASRLGLRDGERLSDSQKCDGELIALLSARLKANEKGQRCDVEWHKKNGFI